MELFDTHAHLCDDKIWDARRDILIKMEVAGVRLSTLICTCKKDLERAKILSTESSSVKLLLSAATGPNEVLVEGEDFFPLVEEAAQQGWLSAIGETGLDYHWQTSPQDLQKQWFIRYLDLARKYHLPVIIHCRKAFQDIVEILDRHYLQLPGAMPGVFHCFAEGWQEACEVTQRGFLVSFSGIVTYKSAQSLWQVAERIDSSSYVIETDSPYLTPGKDRSKLNEPANVALVAEKIAQLRNESVQKVCSDSTRNASRLFNLK